MCREAWNDVEWTFLTFCFSPMKAMQRNATTKVSKNYVFFRNWAVRNPAGTRLDSSLVNKQVAMFRAFFVLKCNACMNSLLNTWNNTRLNTWMRRTFLTLLSRCDCQQRTGQAG